MKKSIVLFSIACAAYGATLLALGIYLMRYDIAAEIARALVERLSILGLILLIPLYLPLLLLQYSAYVLILSGAGYILFFARLIYNYRKGNLLWLHKSLRILNFSHCCLCTLIFIADLIIFTYIFRHIDGGVSAALIVFTVLITLTAIALIAANVFAVKKQNSN